MYYALLQRDDKGFAHPERIQKLLKNYSQFVSFPIYTWQEKGFTKEVTNPSSSLWLLKWNLAYARHLLIFQVEVDEDPAEVKTEGDGEPKKEVTL